MNRAPTRCGARSPYGFRHDQKLIVTSDVHLMREGLKGTAGVSYQKASLTSWS